MQSSNVTLTPGVPWDAIERTQEVHPTMVSDYIKRGWVILASYMAREDLYEQFFENGYQQQRTRCEYKPVVLMGQTIVDTLREENAGLRSRVASLEPNVAELCKLQRDHELLQKNCASSEASRKRAEESEQNAQRRMTELSTEKRKMEADIGKLRAAIGEIRMKEILGA